MNLILATSQHEHLKRFASHTPPRPDNHYVLTIAGKEELSGASDQASGGDLSSYLHTCGSNSIGINGTLLGLLRQLKPARVVLLLDNPARQGAVVAALYFWRFLYALRFELLVSWSGKPPVALDSYHRYLLFRHGPRSFNKELVVFIVFKLALLIWVATLVGPKLIPIMMIHLVAGEILYRWRDNKWRRRLAASPLGRRGRHDRGDRWHPFDEYLGLVEAPNLDTMACCSAPSEATDYTYRTRTNAQGWRITAESDKPQDGPIISIFGCSFTFGSGLNDEETYGWQLQERFPDFALRNYGIGASSAYQALLLIEKTIRLEKPAAVVFGYQPTMDKRNVGRLDLLPWYAGPSCVSRKPRSGKRVLRRYPPKRYKTLPLARRSSLIKALEKKLNWMRTIGRNSDAVARATMEHIFAQMRFTCEKHGVPFIVASLTAYNPHQAYLQSSGFSWCSVDFDEKETDGDGRYKWSLLPYDKHPNAAANREFCRVIGDAVEKELRNERAVPEASVLNHLAQLNQAPRKLEEFIYPHW